VFAMLIDRPSATRCGPRHGRTFTGTPQHIGKKKETHVSNQVMMKEKRQPEVE
jgi:hypothetical protein